MDVKKLIVGNKYYFSGLESLKLGNECYYKGIMTIDNGNGIVHDFYFPYIDVNWCFIDFEIKEHFVEFDTEKDRVFEELKTGGIYLYKGPLNKLKGMHAKMIAKLNKTKMAEMKFENGESMIVTHNYLMKHYRFIEQGEDELSLEAITICDDIFKMNVEKAMDIYLEKRDFEKCKKLYLMASQK